MNIPVHPNPALYTSPEMIAELAIGLDPPYEIAARYGLSQREFDKLQGLDWFGEMILRKRMEYAEHGQLFEAKSKMMLEELLQLAFKSAITGTMPANLVLELTKQLGEYSGVKRQPVQAAGAGGPAFQINIQVNGADLNKARTTRIDAPIEAKPVVVSVPMEQALPPQPEGFRVPDFDTRVRKDLIGSPTAMNAAVASSVVSR